MATLNAQIQETLALIEKAEAAGNTRRVANLRSQLKELRAQARAAAAERQTAPGEQTDTEPAASQTFEERFQTLLGSYMEAAQGGDSEQALAAVADKRQLTADLFEAYMAAQRAALAAGGTAALQSDPLVSQLESMYHNLNAFLLTEAGGSQLGTWWARPGGVVDTAEEKLRGWGLTDEQFAQWEQYRELVDGGMGRAEAAAQAGLDPAKAAGWDQVATWKPEVWSQNYNDMVSGVAAGLPEREGAAALGGPLYTVQPGIGSFTPGDTSVTTTPTYGGSGFGTVPGTNWTWAEMYGRAGAESAMARMDPSAYTLGGGWTSGFNWDEYLRQRREKMSGYDERTGEGPGGAYDLNQGYPGTPVEGGPVSGTGGPRGGPVGETVDLKQTGREAAKTEEEAPAGPIRIPGGGTLIRKHAADLADPNGGIFYVMYDVNGVQIVYEVGKYADAQALLGANFIARFDTYRSMSNNDFNAAGFLTRGLIDEVAGSTESIQQQITRALNMAKLEDIPAWMKNDREIMTIITVGTLEEWSAGRIWGEIADTSGFAARFPAFDKVKRRIGGGTATITETVATYLNEEQILRDALLHYRGRNTDTSKEYLGVILQAGWSAAEASEVLEAENLLNSDPSILDNLNAILRASGMNEIDGPDIVDIMRGNAPTRVYEALNDAMRLKAMRQAGLEVSPEFAAEFGEGIAEQVASAEQRGAFSAAASQAALDLIQNWREVDLGKLGVSKDDVIRAAFGEGFAAETEARLLKFQRERQTAGQGWGGYSAYQTGKGQLALTGLKQL